MEHNVVNVLAPILKYAEENFIDGDCRVQYENYRNLLSFMRTAQIDKYFLDSFDYEALLNESTKLYNMISILVDSNDLTDMETEDFFNGLALCYMEKRERPTIAQVEEDEEEEKGEKKDKNAYGYRGSKQDREAIKAFVTSLPEALRDENLEAEKLHAYHDNGDLEARKYLIEHNLRLVASIAKRYAAQQEDFFDYFQVGYEGLVKSIEKYDFAKGKKLSTYATWWIKQKIFRYIADNSRNVRLPVHMNELLKKIERVSDDYYKEHGEQIPSELLCELVEATQETIDLALTMKSTRSTNEPLNREDGEIDTELGDMLQSGTYNPEDVIAKVAEEQEGTLYDAAIECINRLFEKTKTGKIRKLTPKDEQTRERYIEIIRFRYGFVDGKFHTYEEVGNIYHVTRQRIEQIDKRILRYLRRDKKIKTFDPFRGNALLNDNRPHHLGGPALLLCKPNQSKF